MGSGLAMTQGVLKAMHKTMPHIIPYKTVI
jgi:hypothetical protein